MAYRIRSYDPHRSISEGGKTFRWQTVETNLTRQEALSLAKKLQAQYPLERFRVTEDATI